MCTMGPLPPAAATSGGIRAGPATRPPNVIPSPVFTEVLDRGVELAVRSPTLVAEWNESSPVSSVPEHCPPSDSVVLGRGLTPVEAVERRGRVRVSVVLLGLWTGSDEPRGLGIVAAHVGDTPSSKERLPERGCPMASPRTDGGGPPPAPLAAYYACTAGTPPCPSASLMLSMGGGGGKPYLLLVWSAEDATDSVSLWGVSGTCGASSSR